MTGSPCEVFENTSAHPHLCDTIVALATAPGIGALAIVRLSGPDAISILQGLVGPRIHALASADRKARHVVLGHAGVRIDDGVATIWKGPASYTGEDVVEISCHGNPLIVKRLLAACLILGAREARPGEFTERAFLNGRMDLTQAEAVLEVIQADSENALAGAQAVKTGRLGEELNGIRRDLIDLLAHLEAYIDFPEEDIDPDTGQHFLGRMREILAKVQRLLATAPLGRILRDGITVAIVGPPNVGKSSLLNALLRENRAIVSPIPGTTRDTVEADCHLRGFRLRLVDTAGQRETDNSIEAEGIRRAKLAAENAEILIEMVEGPRPPPPRSEAADSPAKTVLRVASKADLGVHPGHSPDFIAISTAGPPGIQPLEDAIEGLLLAEKPPQSKGWVTINARHEIALRRASEALDAAIESWQQGAEPECVSVDLRGALGAVGEVVGISTNEDILDALFQRFCIGK
jgi:tRNA modification GTPase